MKLTVLVVLVALQVVVFQFLAVRLSRVLPGYLVGSRELPAETVAGIGRYRRRLGRGRWWAGIVLLMLLGFAGSGVVAPGAQKLVVTAVSLASSAILLIGYVRDRRRVGTLALSVPVPARRTGTLERATLSRHYGLGWEVVPVAAWIATLVLAVIAIWAGEADAFGPVVLQTGVVVGGFLLSLWYARSGPGLPQRARAHLGEPQMALGLDASLRTLELRALLATRIGIVVLLCLKQAETALPVLGVRLPLVLGVLEWGVIAGLLAVFAVYVRRLGREPDAPSRTPARS